MLNPEGKRVAEMKAGANGTAETVVTLGAAGDWSLKVKGDGVPSVSKPLVVR